MTDPKHAIGNRKVALAMADDEDRPAVEAPDQGSQQGIGAAVVETLRRLV